MTLSNAKVVELPFANNAADLSKQETHLPQEMEPNAVIATRILDEIYDVIKQPYLFIKSYLFNWATDGCFLYFHW